MRNHRLLSCVLISLGAFIFTACSSAEKKDDKASLGDEVSLKSDRSQYDDLRKDIPDEIRRENDELAFVRSLMATGEEEPPQIRERYSKAVRDRRDKFDKAMRRRRDDYSKTEKRKRDDFLKKLKDERETYLKENVGKKTDSEKRRQFFEDQEARRQDFFSDEKDNRREFESEATEQRKNFESYLTERQNKFNQEIRDYSTSFAERRKALELKKKSEDKAKDLKKEKSRESGQASGIKIQSASPHEPATGDPDLEQFKQIPQGPATPLGADPSGN